MTAIETAYQIKCLEEKIACLEVKNLGYGLDVNLIEDGISVISSLAKGWNEMRSECISTVKDRLGLLADNSSFREIYIERVFQVLNSNEASDILTKLGEMHNSGDEKIDELNLEIWRNTSLIKSYKETAKQLMESL